MSALYNYQSNQQVQVEEVIAGDIAVVAGFDDFNIGDTITDPDNPQPLMRITIDEPTVGVLIAVNDGPFFRKRWKISHKP